MGFFGIGIGEILLVLVFSLIIWGPKRMIEIARTLGKLVHTLRKVTSDLTATVAREMDADKKDQSPQRQSNPTNDASQLKTPQK